MKKASILIVMLCGFLPLLWAQGDKKPRLTKEEFRDRQRTFITERAELTKEEAEKFFPLFFELQDRKQVLNDKAWKLMRQGRKEDLTEEGYEEILESVYDTRIASDELEKSYFEKFKEILSCKKLYEVQQAEMRFHREWLKNLRGKGNHRKPDSRTPAPRK